MKRIAAALCLTLLCSCGDGGTPPPSNIQTQTSNNASNNGTSGSNNTTVATNNGTTGSNNATTSTTNTSGNNQTCVDLDPALGDCDPLCQSGCDAGEHCILSAAAEAACAPSGVRSQDDACSADTECAVGLHCRSVGADPKTCLNYCNPDGESRCSADHGCVRLAADQRVGACVPVVNDCDTVPLDTCADPDECYDTVQGRQCLPAGSVIADEECGFSSDCAPGLRCVNVMDVGQVCKPTCDPNGVDECVDGTCRQLRSPQGQTLTWGACY